MNLQDHIKYANRKPVNLYIDASFPPPLADGPVDCVWSAFGEWGACSVSCGPGGVERRRRKMLQQAKGGGRECRAEDAVESRLCRRTPRQCAGRSVAANHIFIVYQSIHVLLR